MSAVDLSNPESVRREALRRQQLRAQGVPSFNLPEPSASIEPRQTKGRTMNKTEARRAAELTALVRAGEIQCWMYEAITLKLADDCRYTPDFFIVDNDTRIRFEETKGHWRDDARVKIKVAAKLFPMFRFTAFTARKKRDGGGWKTEEF